LPGNVPLRTGLVEGMLSALLVDASAAIDYLREQLGKQPQDSDVLEGSACSVKEKIDRLLQRESLTASERTTH